jgi:ERO1-like protein alpha
MFIGHNLFKKLDKNLTQWEKANKLNFTQFQNDEMLYNIQEVLNHNEKFYETLQNLKKTLFFKIFKLNLEPECTLFQQEKICKDSACKICECDENEVPKIWEQKTHRGEFLNIKIEDPFNKWIDKYTINTKQWLLEEDVDSKDGTYINLLKNPEGYTGYRGAHIWNAIFKENCLSDNYNTLCKDDKFFFKLFSGWLSNTNFQIGMNFHDIVKNTTFINVTMLTERLLNEKDRVDNFFFLYSLMLKAINKGKNFLLNYDYFSGNETEDKITLNLINELFNENSNNLNILENSFNETSLEFENFMHSQKISNLIIRFRNISSLIDCVSCSKCRMHAKLEIFGIATMFKIMFANNNELKEIVKRNELVSFLNLFAKLSKTISNMEYVDREIKKAHLFLKIIYFIIFGVFGFILLFFNVLIYRKENKNKKYIIVNEQPKKTKNEKTKKN